MNEYERHKLEDARLVILKELANQTDFRLNQNILSSVLDAFGHKHPIAWLRDQLRELEKLEAIVVHETGSVMVAEITRNGLDHCERRVVIEGIKRPSPSA